jgi:hypothetical protein
MRVRAMGLAVVVMVGGASCMRFIRDVKGLFPQPLPLGTLGANCEADGGCSQGECIEWGLSCSLRPPDGKASHTCLILWDKSRPCPEALEVVVDLDCGPPPHCEPPSIPNGTLGGSCLTDGGCTEGACLEWGVDRPHSCLIACDDDSPCPKGLECPELRGSFSSSERLPRRFCVRPKSCADP